MTNQDFREHIAKLCGFGKEFTIKGAPRAHPCVVREKKEQKIIADFVSGKSDFLPLKPMGRDKDWYSPKRDKRHKADCAYQRINATKGECDCGYFKLPKE